MADQQRVLKRLLNFRLCSHCSSSSSSVFVHVLSSVCTVYERELFNDQVDVRIFRTRVTPTARRDPKKIENRTKLSNRLERLEQAIYGLKKKQKNTHIRNVKNWHCLGVEPVRH